MTDYPLIFALKEPVNLYTDVPTLEESVMGPVVYPKISLVTSPTRILSLPEATVVIRLNP